MKINKIYDDVYEIENFLTESEFEEVKKLINSFSEEDWNNEEMRVKNQIPDFWFGKQIVFNEENIFSKANKKMESLFASYSYYPLGMILQRYKKGDFIQHHADQWRTDIDYYIGYGLCLYFNDDYEGGELDYPDLKITIKPKANSLFIHGGHIVHGSLPVLSDDIRYFTTVFVRGTTELPTKLNPELFA